MVYLGPAWFGWIFFFIWEKKSRLDSENKFQPNQAEKWASAGFHFFFQIQPGFHLYVKSEKKNPAGFRLDSAGFRWISFMVYYTVENIIVNNIKNSFVNFILFNYESNFY
jgi:hypothetical protein